MRNLLIPAFSLALCTVAMAAPTTNENRPGETATQGTLGAGTVNDPHGTQAPAVPGGATARGQRGEPASTVNAGVDRTTTTATTGSPIPFGNVDRDGNGYIDVQEAQVLKDSGHDFNAADANHDGLLSASEYQRMAGSRTP